MPKPLSLLSHPNLCWNDDVPSSETYSDVYYSRHSGIDESKYIFLDGNQLEQRWCNLANNQSFVIAETGFGTGLNFLLSAALWLQTAPSDSRLHFISCELHPLNPQQLTQAIQKNRAAGEKLYENWNSLADQLLATYPNPFPGFHRIHFENRRISLTLLLGDANHMLPKLHDSIDRELAKYKSIEVNAWFLDGFAPNKNPEIWQDSLFASIASLSSNGTTAASFTVAGSVRKGLAKNGFHITKRKGFGRKREMLCATYDQKYAETIPHSLAFQEKQSWLFNSNYSSKDKSHTSTERKSVIVIGAGLAGCHIANELAQRNFEVRLFDQHNSIASEASGNPIGILHCKVSPFDSNLSQFSLASLEYALNYYHDLIAKHPDIGDFCGIRQFVNNDKEHGLHTQIEQQFGTKLNFLNILEGELHFHNSGWLKPAEICRVLTNHNNIEIVTQKFVNNIEWHQEHWQLRDRNNQVIDRSTQVVIASGLASNAFKPTHWLPIRPIRGQITYLENNRLSDQSSLSDLTQIHCADGYITPNIAGTYYLGATFQHNNHSPKVEIQDHRENLKRLEALIHKKQFNTAKIDCTRLSGRVGFRCSTPDYLPICGAIADREHMLKTYYPLSKNANRKINQPGNYLPGLQVMTGFGSRGLTYIPLCAELLACYMNNEPRPLEIDLQRALSPTRFIIRDLIRNRIRP